MIIIHRIESFRKWREILFFIWNQLHSSTIFQYHPLERFIFSLEKSLDFRETFWNLAQPVFLSIYSTSIAIFLVNLWHDYFKLFWFELLIFSKLAIRLFAHPEMTKDKQMKSICDMCYQGTWTIYFYKSERMIQLFSETLFIICPQKSWRNIPVIYTERQIYRRIFPPLISDSIRFSLENWKLTKNEIIRYLWFSETLCCTILIFPMFSRQYLV